MIDETSLAAPNALQLILRYVSTVAGGELIAGKYEIIGGWRLDGRLRYLLVGNVERTVYISIRRCAIVVLKNCYYFIPRGLIKT